MPPQFPIRSLIVSEWVEIYRTGKGDTKEPILFDDDDNMSNTNSTGDVDPTQEKPVWEAQIPEASLADAKEEEQIVMQDLEDDVVRQLKEKVAPVCSSLFGLTCRRFWIISSKPDF